MFNDAKLSDAQIIENAKTWYLQEKIAVRSKLSVNSTLTEITFEPNWEKANVENVNGKRIITTPAKTNLSRYSSLGTKYSLIIEESKESLVGKIVSVNNFKANVPLGNSELYKIAFTDEDAFKHLGVSADIRIFDLNFKEREHVLYTERGARDISITTAKVDNFDKSLNQKTTTTVCYEINVYIWGYDDNGEPAFEALNFGQFCPEINLTTIDFIQSSEYGALTPEQQLEALLSIENPFKTWWNRLNDKEQALLRSEPWKAIQAFSNASRAESYAPIAFPSSAANMHQDAFRHAYWSYLNARSIGVPWAITFGNTHEYYQTDYNQVQMDLHNNGIGANAALDPNCPTTDAGAILYLRNKISGGQMKFIVNGVLVNSY